MKARPDLSALVEAPALTGFWNRLSLHLREMEAKGWRAPDAAPLLVGAVLTPVAMGYDRKGRLPQLVRGKADMKRRKKAAKLARELAGVLREIEREPLRPGESFVDGALNWPEGVAGAIPQALLREGMSDVIARMAEGMEQPPDFAAAPGLASQKPSWRAYVREVRDCLATLDFALREIDAVALANALPNGGPVEISRDAVRDALRR